MGFWVYHASGSTIWHYITRFGVNFAFFSKKCLKILTDNFCGCQLRVHHIVPIHISNNCLKVLRWVSRLVQPAPGSTLLHIGWFPNLLDAFPSQIRLACFFNQKWDIFQKQCHCCSSPVTQLRPGPTLLTILQCGTTTLPQLAILFHLALHPIRICQICQLLAW